MVEQELINLISGVGFPIVITLYLIVKFEKSLQANTLAIESLKDIIAQLCSSKKFK